MYRSIRKTIASSISTFDNPEYFEWHKWLRLPSTENINLEEFQLFLEKSDHWIEAFHKPYISSFAFKPRPQKTSEEEQFYCFNKVKTGAVFFGFSRSSAAQVDFKFSEDVRKIFSKRDEEIDAKNIKKIFSREDEEKETKRDGILLKSIILKKEAKINIPGTKDYLASLQPIVLQFKLLDPKHFFNDSEKRKIYSINIDRINTYPKIYKIKSLIFNKNGMPVYSLKKMNFPEIQVENGRFSQISKIYVAQKNLADFVKSKGVHFKLTFNDEDYNNSRNSEISHLLRSILAPLNKRLINYTENLQRLLFDYQNEGVEFLLSRDTALIADDLGLGKTFQTIIAVNKLFAEDKINSVLIICPDEEIGNWDDSIYSDHIQGWIGHICKFTFQLTYNILIGDRRERSAGWKKHAHITIASYNKMLYDIEENIVDKNTLSKIDCLILDEVIQLEKNIKTKKLFNSLNLKYLWMLNNTASKKLLQDIHEKTGQNIHVQNYLRRTKSEIAQQVSKVIIQDYWLEMDENQKVEYQDSLKAAQEQMYFFLEAGNPLRFQANIFTILHKLSQVSNFSGQKETSPKSDLLLKHLSAISQSGEKVIVFSQYEKFGTKNICDVLLNAGIKCLAFEPGLSTKEMQTILTSFKLDKTITALVVGMKGAKLKYELPDVKYVIHFDQWWNPATSWQTEEIIRNNGKKIWEGEINFYNYRTKNTVEENLQRLLFDRGLLDKNIFEFISPLVFSNLVTIEEWLDVLGVKSIEWDTQQKLFNEKLNAISSLSIDELKTKMKSLLSALGYKDLVLHKSKSNKEFIMYGSYQTGNKPVNETTLFIKEEIASKDRINEFIYKTKTKPNAGKIFIITTGKFEDNQNVKLEPNVSLIDLKLFVKYLLLFNIT